MTDTRWLKRLAGKFIVFDGPDGSGKSTQIARFAAACRAHDIDLLEVREPGGTAIGERIRDILLDPANARMNVRCEMMLYMASRAQLVAEKIAPALEAGKLVLADRFISSTLAYQGMAGGLPIEEILAVGNAAIGDHWPDLTLVFDVDAATAAKRLNPLLDRMERKGVEFHRRVREGFLSQAKVMQDTYIVIDARGDADDVWRALLEQMRDHLRACT